MTKWNAGQRGGIRPSAPSRSAARRAWLRSGGLLLLALTLGCGAPAAPPLAAVTGGATEGDGNAIPRIGMRRAGQDWPRFLGPTGDSRSAETGLPARFPTEGLPVVWYRDIGLSYGMPSISRGRLFQFTREGREAVVLCLEAETGRELWRFAYASDYDDAYGYNNGPRTAPTVDDDRLYVFGVEGMLYCLRASDGRPVWQVDTQRQFGVVQNFFGVGASPVIEGELLILPIGGSPPGNEGRALDRVEGNGSGIVAFDKRTGAVRYQLTDELAAYASPVVATIDQRRWGFVFARGGLVGFDPQTGRLDFHFPWRARILESVNASNPVVVGDEVLISETYGPGAALLRVRPGGYQVVWSDAERGREKALMTHWNTPIHHEGYVYACSGRHSETAELRCVEWKTGRVMWSEPGLARTSLLYVDGHLLCLAEDGRLLLLRPNPEKFDKVAELKLRDPDDGKLAGDKLIDYPAWAAPVLAHGLLYLRGERRLVCAELIPQ